MIDQEMDENTKPLTRKELLEIVEKIDNADPTPDLLAMYFNNGVEWV